MALTALVTYELSRLPVTRLCCRTAEVSATVRYADGLHAIDGRILVEAALDTQDAARRLSRDITDVFGYHAEMVERAPDGLRRTRWYVLRLVRDGHALAQRAGLLDSLGRPVRGLPARIVSGPACDAAAVWRGRSWRTDP